MPSIGPLSPIKMQVLMDDEEVAAAGPVAGDGLLLESDSGGTSFLLLESDTGGTSVLLLESA